MDLAFQVQQNILQNYFSSSSRDGRRRPFLVALCGIPGSGKSYVSEQLERLLPSNPRLKAIPMDGYHLPLNQLPEDRVYHRGALDTFDLKRFREDVLRLKEYDAAQTAEFRFPGFDHAKGDPEEDLHSVVLGEGGVDIILIEGLYVLADEVKDLFDLSFFLNADVDRCIERLKVRNQAIPGYSKEQIAIRCDAVDRVNALFVTSMKDRAQVCLPAFT